MTKKYIITILFSFIFLLGFSSSVFAFESWVSTTSLTNDTLNIGYNLNTRWAVYNDDTGNYVTNAYAPTNISFRPYMVDIGTKMTIYFSTNLDWGGCGSSQNQTQCLTSTPPLSLDFWKIADSVVSLSNTSTSIYGCMNSSATNYDSTATEDTDPTSCTYDLPTCPIGYSLNGGNCVDTTLPIVTLTSPEDNSVTDANSTDFKFVTNDNQIPSGQLLCTFYFDNGPTTIGLVDNGVEKTYTYNISQVGNGSHLWYVNCQDNGGLSNNSNLRKLNIGRTVPDTTRPVITADFFRQGSGDGYAKVGDTVEVAISSNETLVGADIVKSVAGHTIGNTWSPNNDYTWFYYIYTMQSSDTEGPLTYSLTGHDAAGNSTTVTGGGVTFDKTAPTLIVPKDYIVEATSGSGAILNYVASATDVNPANPEVACVPPSDSTFPLGTTTVSCSATDFAGNTGTDTFNVTVIESADTTPTVEDTTNPVITLLGDNPATVTVGDTYLDAGATATDDVDGDITLNIKVGNSVDTTTVGTYTITYDVMDAAGNKANQVDKTVNVIQARKHSSGSSGGSGGGYILGGQVLGASTGPIDGCGNRTTGFSITTGKSCIGNTGEGQVLGAEHFNFTLLLKMGSIGNEVIELQKFLNGAGYGILAVDGIFGPKTKAAVIKFQIASGLVGDGIVGPLTLAVLNR